MLRPTLALLVGAALAGCSLFTDLSGFSAATGETDPNRGTGDGGTDDAASSGDASLMPRDGGTTSAGCTDFPGAAFCADFEDNDPLSLTKWTDVDLATSEGTIATTTQFARSPSHGVLLDLTSPKDCARLAMEKKFEDKSATQMSVHFSVRPEKAGAFAALDIELGGTRHYVLRIGVDGPLAFRALLQEELGTAVSDLDARTLATTESLLDRFHDVVVRIATVPTPKIQVEVGQLIAELTPPNDYVIDEPSLLLGPYCTSEPTRMTIDDVAVIFP